MEIAGISLEYLGAAALPIAILWYWNTQLRKDVRILSGIVQAERKLSIEQSQSYLDIAIQNTEAMGKLATALDLLRAKS